MKKILVFFVAALAIPTSVAFAKPSHPAEGGKSGSQGSVHPQGDVVGVHSVRLGDEHRRLDHVAVRHSNYHGRLLKNQSLTFALTANSKVTFRHKSTLDEGQTARGVLVVRALRRIPGDLVAGLPGAATRIHVEVLKDNPAV